MSKPKIQFCFYCGTELGVYAADRRDLECCGEPECNRALRGQYQAEEADARDRAEQDNYEAYR